MEIKGSGKDGEDNSVNRESASPGAAACKREV